MLNGIRRQNYPKKQSAIQQISFPKPKEKEKYLQKKSTTSKYLSINQGPLTITMPVLNWAKSKAPPQSHKNIRQQIFLNKATGKKKSVHREKNQSVTSRQDTRRTILLPFLHIIPRKLARQLQKKQTKQININPIPTHSHTLTFQYTLSIPTKKVNCHQRSFYLQRKLILWRRSLKFLLSFERNI